MGRPFWKLMTQAQVQHLRDMKIHNETEFWKTRKFQKKQDDEQQEITCIDCRLIDQKITELRERTVQ